MWYKAVPLWVWTALTVLVPAQSSPPVITNFLQRDLVNPEDVKAQAAVGFRLPCKATGSNLKWIWEHNGKNITAYRGRPFTLSDDGTLTGSFLNATESGTYQCFVRDEKTGAVAFSRKLNVAVTVVGAFINTSSVVKKVNLGEPFSYDCPPHEYSYGVVYSWEYSDGDARLTFARNKRRSISSNGTLYIMYLTQEDIDEIGRHNGIRCIISGANFVRRSGTLSLEKIDKVQQDSENSTLPVWFVTPRAEEIAVQGKNKTLFCFASGRPPPTITWKKDGKLIQQEESSFNISESFYGRRLSIQNVDKELHEGTYTCEAQNDLNTEKPLSFNFRLNVEVPPQWTTDPPPQNITIVIEKNGTLECKVTAKPPAEVSWYKNGQLLQSSERHTVDGSNLHLLDVNLDDYGVYQCVAVNAHGMIISATSINVAVPPSLTRKPSNQTIIEGQEVKFHCIASGNPAPNITWTKDGNIEAQGDTLNFEAHRSNAGKYWCSAENGLGISVNSSAYLDVQFAPSLITTPADQTVLESTTATFHCNATGNPTPKIKWIKDGKTEATGNTMSFDANRTHSGKYWCLAENGVKTVNASANLDVQFLPSLTTKPSNQTVIENQEATFQCTATGNPTPPEKVCSIFKEFSYGIKYFL